MSVSKEFVLAGDATFTVELPDGDHKTYRVQYSEPNDKIVNGKLVHWKESWFVKMLTGADNENSYSYLGKLDAFTGNVSLTAKSKFKADSLAYRLINRILARIWSNDHDAYESKGYQVHHEGKCGRCGRKLTVPSSIESGIGPECMKRMEGGLATTAKTDSLISRIKEKAAYAEMEAEMEQQAFESDPDYQQSLMNAEKAGRDLFTKYRG